MKQKRKSRTLKLVLLFIGILIVNSCEEDEIQNVRTFGNPNLQLNHNHESSIITQKLSSSEFPHKREIRNYLSQIESNTQSQVIGNVSYNEGSGSDINPLSGLNIIQDQAEYTTYNGGHTYTFATYRDNSNDSDIIENIVLESDGNGGYDEYLFKYLLDETEYQDLQNGLLSESDLINQTIIIKLENGIANVLVSNSDWCYFPTVVVQGCDGCGGPGPCHDGNNTGDWGNCVLLGQAGGPVTYITYQWQPCGSFGGGSGGTITNPPSGQPGVGDLPPAGGGGSVNPKPGNPNDGNPGDQGNDPPNEEEPVDEIGGVTKPIKDLEISNPCEKIDVVFNQYSTFKQKLIDLSNTVNEGHENAKGIYEDGTEFDKSGNSQQPFVNLDQNPASKYVVIAHTHYETTSTPDEDTYSIFSLEDLQFFSQRLRENELDHEKFVAFLITGKGTRYALTISNKDKFLNFFKYVEIRKKWANGQASTPTETNFVINTIIPIHDKYFDKETIPKAPIKINNTDNNKVLQAFLQFMNEADIGVDLFSTDSSFTSYTKLKYDQNEQDKIKKTPCN